VHGFKNARFKGFADLTDAQKFIGIFDSATGSDGNKKPAARNEKRSAPAVNVSKEQNPAPTKRPRVDATPEGGPRVISVLICFDGGSRGNPGVAGAGAEVILTERTAKQVQKARRKIHLRQYLGSGATNNEGEWTGALEGLKQTLEQVQKFKDRNENINPRVEVVVQGDSQLVIRQLDGTYQCRNAKLKPLLIQFKETLSKLEGMVDSLKISYQHVYRSDNAVADRK
jgi:ribonuclease HI